MVTREEEHSTRGRANLLRAVLSGSIPGETLASPRLHEALDLCLECKGCKADCQTGVDMAKLKYEFLDQYNKAHGTPLRSRIFANINTLSRLGSRLAPLSNWASASPLSKWVLQKFLGVAPQRTLPAFAGQTFPGWFKERRSSSDSRRSQEGKLGTVVLFNDTFMNYNYPNVGIAAVELLERAGYNVVPANPMCCGRPMVSKGMLDKARANARHNVDLLYSYAQQGIPIVGCEPSCLLTLRDEYPDLLRDDKSKVVAENSYMIDELIAMLQDKGDLALEFNDVSGQKVLFHGHCHQKSLVGTRQSMSALRLAGYQVEEVNSGCCGMAGSFGYEKEHYDISMDIGRQVLFPAVESKDADWQVAVMGISCRQQIEHGTGRIAKHLVEVLRDAVK
jgi:Fe-S oxidoreductase